ncbi:chemotaxis protein CheA [mine drainage metagenome]|uniref:Chemotaxis protein CheA n=1 Tax=mine drainage metagenome TaxID=410659 RepID=A0A1J5RKZ2_9ZZZZ
MNIDEALPTFIAESRELLASMEDCLMLLEQQLGDADAINATFRAIHTIKGSAGLFGLEDIVRFAHVVENVLDRARNGELPVTDQFTAVMLECGDHIGHLVDQISNAEQHPAALLKERGAKLFERLGQFSPLPSVAQATAPVEHTAAVEASGGGEVGSDAWHISLRFGPEVLRNGMDPASFLRYLTTLGDVQRTVTLWDAMPEAAAMDPELCYLGFEITLMSEASKETIEAAFDFVRDDCQIRILPPHSRIEQYLKLIEDLPEGAERVGEILLACGALSPAELADALAEQQAVNHGSDAGAPLGEILVHDQVVHEAVVHAALDKQQRAKDRRSQEAKFVRVDAAKLEALITQVGEMVIAGASASLRAQSAGDGALNEAMSLMGRLVEEIRDGALSLRMVEIGETFHRFQRVVRDVSRELGKDIELVTSGNDTELDKMVVEKINDPLMHLVRNAIDHGIEASELRQARGKPVQARVALNAYHESGSIIIEVADDGGGLNREKILNKAVERGIVSSGQNLSDHEIHNLIFEPGFSTAERVTNISGRGVGMDVVRRNIEALRGSIELDSQEGLGTTVRIRLPLTLAIIDGFLIGVGPSSFVVPLDMVVECLELTAADREGRRDYLNLRGEVLPFVRLRQLFDIEGEKPRRENVVVVHYAGQKAGLVVDRLLGEFQTVIKPLGGMFRHLRGISGSTILGSGEVALILDVPATIQHAANRESQQTERIAASTHKALSLQSAVN